jgi:pantoate--beta-alanine ligase
VTKPVNNSQKGLHMTPVITTIADLQARLSSWRTAGQSVGLVATMGYLHEGHQSLIRQAAADNDKVVVSIFVNPTQFAPDEDLETYPRDLVQDQARSQEAGADLIFAPTAAELYPTGYTTFVTTAGVSEQLEGKARPTHFRGVTTIVAKLFNLVQPDRAYFGQKDAQQVAVLQQMVRDLNYPLTLVVCPIVREADGLAKSSRNAYLDEAQRAQAVCLSQALQVAKEEVANGQRQTAPLITAMQAVITAQPLAKIDYIAIVDPMTLVPLTQIDQEALILLAVYIGQTRLIDNHKLQVED